MGLGLEAAFQRLSRSESPQKDAQRMSQAPTTSLDLCSQVPSAFTARPLDRLSGRILPGNVINPG
jgi:hypothetical protein